MKYFIFFIFIISFFSIASEEHDHHSEHNHDHNKQEKEDAKALKAHEHGKSLLNIVQDGNTLSFEFEMPGFDVVGFEYKAKKKEDIKIVNKALKIMSDYKNMIVLSESGKCNENKNNVKVINEGSHSEFLSEYILICKNISKIKEIDIRFFSSFKYSKKLDIKLVSKNKKITFIADKSNNIISVVNYF